MQQVSWSWKAVVNENLCTGCGKCIRVCGANAIRILNNKAVVNFCRCFGCTYCTRTCSQEAIGMALYSYPISHREGQLDLIKTQLNEIGLQLGAIEKSFEVLERCEWQYGKEGEKMRSAIPAVEQKLCIGCFNPKNKIDKIHFRF